MIQELFPLFRVDTAGRAFIQEGVTEYAVLPDEEFLRVQEELEDYEDLRCLREAKEIERAAPTIELRELKKKIGRRTIRSSRRR
jgi:dynactin complex subunit